MEKFGQQIQKYRKKLGLAQHELAKKINVSQVAISKWENNLNEPDMKTLIDLAVLFDTSLEELIGYRPQHQISHIQRKKQLLNTIIISTRRPLLFSHPTIIDTLEEAMIDELIDELAETIDYSLAKQKKQHFFPNELTKK